MKTFTLVLGTRNLKKRRELEYLLGPYGIQLKTLDEFPAAIEVEEIGATFQNSLKRRPVVRPP